MKRLIALLMAAVMLLSLAACGAKEEAAEETAKEETAAEETAAEETKEETAEETEEAASGEAAYKETLRIGSEEDLETADPYGSTSASTAMFTNHTFNTLIWNDVETREIMPELATSWEDVNGDATVWDIHLVENAKFHNGSAFTAKDVVFTWNRIIDATQVIKVFSGAQVENCTGVEAVDDYTVRFSFSQPMPDFVSYLDIKIYSEEAFNTMDAKEAALIGTGPFYYNAEKTQGGSQFTCTRFDEYWEGLDNYPTKELVFVVQQSMDTMVAALQAGECDAIFNVAANQYGILDADDNITLATAPGAYSYYIGVNYRNPDFADQGLRIAIQQALDKQAIVDIAFEGMATVSNCLVTPVAIGYTEDYTPIEQDVEAAKAYIEENGYAGKTYKMTYPNAKDKPLAECIQADLAAIGLNIELQQVDVTNWTAHKASNDYDMFCDALGQQGALLYNVNRIFYTGGSSNQYGHANPDYEAAQDKVSAQATWEDMKAEFKNLQQFIVDECAVIPTVYDTFIFATRNNVGGLFLANSKNYCDFSTLYATVE